MKVFDSSPIIAILGNIANPELLICFVSLGYSLYAPKKVIEEVTKEPSKQNLQKLLKSENISELEAISDEETKKFRDRYPRLGKGESELILWGLRWKKENKKFCCIIDDSMAKKTAERFGLRCNGTIGLLNKLNDRGLIDHAKLNSYFKILEMCGFRYKFKSTKNNL